MYGLSKNEDLQLMVGATLTQVCVGENEIILNFDKPVAVTILAEFAVSSYGGAAVRYEETRSGASSLFGLIGAPIERATVTDDGGLLITFSLGTLEVFDTCKEYESIWIKLGDKQIIV